MQTVAVEYHPMAWLLLKNMSLGINGLTNYLLGSNLCFLGRSLRRRQQTYTNPALEAFDLLHVF